MVIALGFRQVLQLVSFTIEFQRKVKNMASQLVFVLVLVLVDTLQEVDMAPCLENMALLRIMSSMLV
jgi:hypothetical protein